mmetsp:Transcript_887/g.1597  ORF Transcript_887/g.1597 Transcript_887/m.1597 type:complete len:204 (-) Transcript_887:256-867(-)
MVGGDGVKDEVHLFGLASHLLGVGGHHKSVSALLLRHGLLVGRSGDSHNGVAESLGELDAHGAEASDSDDSDGHLLSLGGSPDSEGLVHGDSGAEKGSSLGEVEVVGELDAEVLRDSVRLSVASEGLGLGVSSDSFVLLLSVVGHHIPIEAVLLVSLLAVLAIPARVDHAANSHLVSNLDLGDLGANLGDDSCELMSWNNGVD